MSNEERLERVSTTQSALEDRRDNDRTPRPSISREESGTSVRFDERSSRFERSSNGAHDRDRDTSRLLTRDFAEHEPQQRLRHVRSNVRSFKQPSIHRRLGSIHPSPSPGPAYSWKFMDSDRRSVAIASGRDWDTASRKFSLAGPAPFDTQAANQPYIDPGYAQLNPAYDQPANVRPVWGLAKPLPHVLRPGMVPTRDELAKEVSHKETRAASIVDLETGRIEPSLRPGKITAQLDDVRREREIGLFETFQQQLRGPESPVFSPFARSHRGSPATRKIPDLLLDEPIAEEDEEYRHRSSDPGLHHLNESVNKVNRVKKLEQEAKLPYEDAVPLLAYEAEADEVHNLHTYWSVVRLQFREPLAELLGYTLGFSANLALTVSRGAAGVGDTGDWAWGLATMIAIYVAGGVSGAHLNPAISLMLYIYRGFPLSKMPTYILAQLLGAIIATLISFTIFRPGLLALRLQDLDVQGQNIFATGASSSPDASAVLVNFLTFPRQVWVGTGTAFLTELVGTTILAVAVLALGDDTNAPPGVGMNAFIVGLLIAVLGMAFGYNTGLAMNPVRDFGPRLALTMLGYSSDPYPSLFADGYWFRVNWLAPLCGTTLGGFLYDSMIFTGGESPVNYPSERIRRAVRKWVGRWKARVGKTKVKLNEIKDEVIDQ